MSFQVNWLEYVMDICIRSNRNPDVLGDIDFP